MKLFTKKFLAVLAVLLLAVSVLGTVASAAEPVATGKSFDFVKELQPLIDAIRNFSPETALSANFGNSFSIAVVVVALVGLLEALFGYKLLRLELILAGFAAGFMGGHFLLSTGALDSFLTDEWMRWVFLAIIGLLAAFLAFKLFRIALFLSVGFLVYTFAGGIVASYVNDKTLAIVVSIVVGLIVGLIAVKLLRTVVILLTAALGAYLFTFAVAGFIPVENISLILLALIFVIGVAVQIGSVARNRR